MDCRCRFVKRDAGRVPAGQRQTDQRSAVFSGKGPLIAGEMFDHFKPGAVLVNAARLRYHWG